jgi:hypothetical protein
LRVTEEDDVRTIASHLLFLAALGCGADDGPFMGRPDSQQGAGDAPGLADGGGETDGTPGEVDAGDEPVDAAPGGPDAARLTVEAMLATACTGSSCSAAKVAAYWRNEWDTYAVKRTIRFHDLSATEHRLEVTDGAGNPATLEFIAGLPVSLTIVNPGDSSSTGKHNITAPALFRAVAWRRAKSLFADYRAAHFDAVHVRRRSGTDLSVVLEFVPMNPGMFDVYCQTSVPNGNQYEAIVAGTTTPDLTSTAGHAGKGAKTTATITTSFAGQIAQPVAALSSDPRRAGTHAVWGTAVRNDTYRVDPIQFFEFTDEEYAFIPANLALADEIGTVLRIENPTANVRAHAFAARSFYDSAVLWKAQDDDVEVETSTLTSVQALVGGWTELFVVPTMPGSFGSYCEVAVQISPEGNPNLSTGHAGRGMVGSIAVSP